MPNFVGMSPTEVQFIRVYVAAMKRHYFALQTAIDLMQPDNLALTDFYAATRVALETERWHDDFDRKLAVWRKKHKPTLVAVAESPTEDELAELFTLSFFKLLSASETKPQEQLKDASGWFSGHPEEWQNSLTVYSNIPNDSVAAELSAVLTQCFNAFAKLFGQSQLFFKGPFSGSHTWPPTEDEDDEFFEED
jgi:hypothetical protein